jgi:hypothetical protein
MPEQFTVKEKSKEPASQLVRVDTAMYKAIVKLAEENSRSITLQTSILLGAALNRGLHNPSDMT